MATQIFLGNPPETIKRFIIEHYEPKEDPMLKVPLTFTAEEAGAKLSFNTYGFLQPELETSTTGEEGSWEPYINGTEITLANVGDKIMFRSSLDYYVKISSTESINSFNINSGKIAASGNIMFLTHKSGISNLDYGCFYMLFANCKSLTSMPLLPAEVLADECYSYMFYDCTSLTKTTDILATSIDNYGCFMNMFCGCSSLVEPKYKLINISSEFLIYATESWCIFGQDEASSRFEVQCSDKTLIISFDDNECMFVITEK